MREEDRSPQPLPERRLERLPWPRFEAAAAQSGSTVVWPFGAFEQHGPHLPLGTDALFADQLLDGVLAKLAPERPIWRLPLQPIGFSPEHGDFKGTLSLRAEVLLQMVQTVGEQLADAGFQRLVLFNGHGGQIALLQVAARQLRAVRPAMAVLPCFLWSGPQGLAELIPEPERQNGLHAGLAETSLMLHLAPDQVGAERPQGAQELPLPPEGWSLEGAAPTAWLTRDLSRSGVIGDPGGASAELGEALQHRLEAGWVGLFDGLLQSDWPPTRSLINPEPPDQSMGKSCQSPSQAG
jgi:creatinine amidohydrolase